MNRLARVAAALAILASLSPAQAQQFQPRDIGGLGSGVAATLGNATNAAGGIQVYGSPLAAGAAAGNLGYSPAHSGANTDITSIGGLTTPLSAGQGGTGLAALGSGIPSVLGTPTNTTGGVAPIGATVHVYVSKTGASNSYDCLAPTYVSGTHGPCSSMNTAAAAGLFYDVGGGNIELDFASAGTWAESLMINGPIRGPANLTPIPNGSTWGGMLLLNGQTYNPIISGSGSYCYTLGASQGGVLGIENLTVTANYTCGGSSAASDLFAQLAGTIHVFGGDTFGIAKAGQLHAENPGSSIQIWQNYSITGGGTNFAQVGQGALILISAGVGTLSGTPAYNQFLFAYAGGGIQWNISNPWSGAATGAQFFVESNGYFESNGNTGVTQFPGSAIGAVVPPGVFHGPAPATYLSSANLGSTGSVTVTADSTPEAGSLTFTPSGSGIGNYATINVQFPYRVTSSQGGAAFCTAGLSQEGSANFQASAQAITSYHQNYTALADYLAINVYNAGATFVSGDSYVMKWHCDAR